MTPGVSMPESLKALAPAIAQHDAPGVAAMLSPWLERLREPIPPAQVKDAVDAASTVCRALYDHGRSAEALPLARGLLASCDRSGNSAQTRRASGVCGVLAADCSDLVGAIEYHVRSLRIAAADEDRLEMGRVWVLIGNAVVISGRFELGSRCFRRSLALLEPIVSAGAVRFAAQGNLADGLYQLGQLDEGMRHAQAALEELEQFDGQDPYGAIVLRRTLTRLLIAQGRAREATEHVAQAAAIAAAAPSLRSAIAVEVMRVALDLAMGNADLALTRLDRAISQARAVPPILLDAMAYAVRAEETVGNPARALLRLQELSDFVYGHGVERARRVIELAGIDPAEPATVLLREQERLRLAAVIGPPSPPTAWAALRRLAASAVLRMDDTGWHGVRVGALVKALALEWGCGPLQALELGLASELHDIGMASVPAAILAKPGALNDAERAVVRKHAEAGGAVLVDGTHPRLLLARDIARYHHARWDGTGYPDRVAGTAIPLGARMCAIADAYDMMVCGFGGRNPMTMAAALEELQREGGRQFDPELVSCFNALVKGELDGLGVDPSSEPGMEAFQELILSLKEDRGFV
jgi:putative two-component system response regulator